MSYGHAEAVAAALARTYPDAEQAKKEALAILAKKGKVI